MSGRGVRLVLAAYLLVVLRITQWPDLADPSALRWLDRALGRLHELGLPEGIDLVVVEAAANVVMFVPFGILVPLVTRWRPRVTVVAGATFSGLIELSQLAFFPSRVATVQDVLMNTTGATLGVAALLLIGLAADGRTSRLADVTTAGSTDEGSPPEGQEPSSPDPSTVDPSTAELSTDPSTRPRTLDLLGESRLTPVEIDLRRVFLLGIALWALAVVVSTILLLADLVEARAVAICGTGLALGFLALGWERRRRRRATPES